MTAAALPAGFVAPAYAGRSLAAVLPAAAGALGVDLTTSTGIVAAQARATLALPSAERVCVVLVDGLGYRNLAERSGHAPFLRSLLAGSEPLVTCAPSTTAAALATFGTGTSPGTTGMVGYTQRDRLTGALATMVSWDGASDPLEVQRETTVLETLAAAGTPVTTVGPRRFQGSGMTRAALRGSRYRVAERLADRVDAAVDVLARPGLAYLYWEEVDHTGHVHGVDSWQWGDRLEATDGELASLVRRLPRGTLVIVTADHGMVDVDPSVRRDVAHDPRLAQDVDLVGGEPRAVHLYTDRADDVAARWTDVLGDDAYVVRRDDAVEAGLFGAVRPDNLGVLGDVLVLSTGLATVVDSRTQSAASIALRGMHGSLTETEMLVPGLVHQS
ncbi:type I phosphodiesterase/nucleotide pyrophosphatase [Sediminihabitans luteus]|uniref:Type I phosphodiesterase/nucleotide pyrophosphatase n=1 Tax=Sediminihabitans luteus TaxID=1138585 RepID=A0A2M9CQ71_9CELL|nr:alkaline phosphatase family protein [Sediminihabitans luteus]PJJ74080.1 type I phosphodiesterase/nucleotide pyrophosphatase [Sediminihabitans luteus]GII98005.1 nucleotide pyrophosphatase [Sediminihabitans luteus]